MSHLDLFISQSNVFSGTQKPFENARYVVFGVPFDVTSTYRTGARFGPNAIRQASLNIETYSFRSGIDVEDLPLHDAGDLHVSTSPRKTVDMLKLVVADVLAAGKMPVAIGGEHTITLGMLKGLGDKARETAVVSFDAHLDLRREYQGLTLSHTTFMRVINEEVKPAKIMEVGTRAVCREELDYAKKTGITFFTSQQVSNEGAEQVAQKLKEKLEPYENVYLSVDMDVLDPAFAPAVQNPEADGIDTHILIDVVCALCDNRVVGFDVLEIAPVYDMGISAVAAAKVVFEMLCQLEKVALK
ncbi:agmatinase [Candidatus Bathyarchaeota archaeon A05DMB-2]|jgi:agmatinase|nr:agmatinase [Candidatus Bathyarchaeota archaeon A05DMB-2]